MDVAGHHQRGGPAGRGGAARCGSCACLLCPGMQAGQGRAPLRELHAERSLHLAHVLAKRLLHLCPRHLLPEQTGAGGGGQGASAVHPPDPT